MAQHDIRRITILDTSSATDNLGDEIIMESVRRHLGQMFPYGFVTHIASRDLGEASRASINQADHSFVGGTNIMSSHWWRYRRLDFSYAQVWKTKPIIVMGVGWTKYQRKPDPLTAPVYRRLLEKHYHHSVRDRYSQEMLANAGLTNVLYTGCPTMWDFTPEHLADIPTTKAPEVFTTVTAYLADEKADRGAIDLLLRNYDVVHFWPQMHDDMAYMQRLYPAELASGHIQIVQPSVEAARTLLMRGDIDYMGSRLHCGALAIQNKVRALIIAIDNRATEIGRDTGYPVVNRNDFDTMARWIKGSDPIEMIMPFDAIARWKGQFN